MMSRSVAWTALLSALCVWPGASAAADDTLAAARRLYAAAAYEDALRTLDAVEPSPTDPDSAVAVLQQRLLCFVALGRTDEAEQAIRAIVEEDPLYVPDAAAAPPRVRAAFQEQRATLLPGIAKSEYERARAAFEAADYTGANAGFARVLAIVESSPDVTDPALRDVAVLATGFQTLSAKAAAPPSGAAAPAAPAPEAAAAPVAVGPRVYDATDARVAAPAIIQQQVPRWPRQLGPPPRRSGLLELVINEEGTVASARIVQAVHPAYDRLVLAAASSWSYGPAQLDGSAVKFRKMLRLAFQ